MTEVRTRAERTTTSKHFTWIEDVSGAGWSGQRGRLTLARINLGTTDNEGLGRYELTSAVFTSATYATPCPDLEEAKRVADLYFERWVMQVGLEIKP